ncbi:hypothetical protein Q4520_21275, partial [Alteromonas sp. 1_MG-2023]|uniref:hypothetical protein n=1 Tax=Alteromonas sp. 1_MG-2023 TaxID=3062669 RepID=UPI0026E4678C
PAKGHKRGGYNRSEATQPPRLCPSELASDLSGLLFARDTCPTRLCRHRLLIQTVDLDNNNYLKTTTCQKPDDKTAV